MNNDIIYFIKRWRSFLLRSWVRKYTRKPNR